MNTESQIYQVPLNIKLAHLATCFVILLIFAILFSPKMGLPGVIGLTIGASLLAFPKMIVSNDAITMKAVIGKAKVAKFDEGQFSLETMTGFKAMMLGLRMKKLALKYQANNTKAPIFLAITLPDSTIQDVYNNLPDHAKKSIDG